MVLMCIKDSTPCELCGSWVVGFPGTQENDRQVSKQEVRSFIEVQTGLG